MKIADAQSILAAVPVTATNDSQVAHNVARLRHSLNGAIRVGYQPSEDAPGYIQLEVEWLNNALAALAST